VRKGDNLFEAVAIDMLPKVAITSVFVENLGRVLKVTIFSCLHTPISVKDGKCIWGKASRRVVPPLFLRILGLKFLV
jgi:hypothetical protein